MSLKRSLDGSHPVLGILLFNLHNGMQPGTTSRADVDIQAAHNLVYTIEYRRFARHAHQQLVLQTAGKQRLPDGIPAVGDRLDFKNWFLADHILCLRQVNKWPFSLFSFEINRPLQNELCFCRNI